MHFKFNFYALKDIYESHNLEKFINLTLPASIPDEKKKLS